MGKCFPSIVLQEWEGYVTEINENDFVARLLDITAGARREDEEATIPFAQISSEDRAEMRLGSIFRWVIGYAGETEKPVSHIALRDMPRVTEEDLREATEWAEETRRLLGLYDDGPDP